MEHDVRAALYARVSTNEQVRGYSMDGQLENTRTHAEQRDWEVVEEYVDPGYSARTDERPAFKKMIHDGKAGAFDVIVVLKSDRFARNRAHAAMYKQLLREVGVRVVSVTEPVEEGTPAGVILEGMNEVIAEWYSVDLSAKVTDAKRRRAEGGLWNGPVPFGYIVGDDGFLQIEPGESCNREGRLRAVRRRSPYRSDRGDLAQSDGASSSGSPKGEEGQGLPLEQRHGRRDAHEWLSTWAT